MARASAWRSTASCALAFGAAASHSWTAAPRRSRWRCARRTRAGGVVALPAYACVDIGAAAIHAQLRVRLYDVDPDTLSADLDSVARVLDAGADTIVVVAPLRLSGGCPRNQPRLRPTHGARVIEDAAQGAWGSLLGTRLGSFGPLSVLSFGRGKGMTGGGGGALLAIGDSGADASPRAKIAPPASSLRTLVVSTAQWALGRPALYALPSAIPALHLGETIYHPAHDPRAITAASASLVRASLARADADLAVRRRNAEFSRAQPSTREASAPFVRSRVRSRAICAFRCDSRIRARQIGSSPHSGSFTDIQIRSPISPSCAHHWSVTKRCAVRASCSARL